MKKTYIYYLPDEKGKPITKNTKNNAVVIVGANGSGKSKLGAWMEENDFDNIHRVPAQRVLQEKGLHGCKCTGGILGYGKVSGRGIY